MYGFQRYVLVCAVASSLGLTVASAQQGPSTTASKPSTVAGSAPSGSAAAGQKVVIKVGDVQITEAQFNEMYAAFLKDNEGGPVQKAKNVAENYAGSLMLSQQALAENLQNDPEVKRQLELNRIQILSNAEYELLENKAKPNMQEIAAYYNAHLSEFDEVDIRRVFVYKQKPGTQEHGLPAAEAQARADQIHKVLAAGGDAKSLIAGTKDAVDTDPLTFRRGDLPAGLDKAFDMKNGECSQIMDTPDVYSMFCVVRHEKLSLTQATPIIEKKLQAQKLREEMDALKKKSGVWMDEEYFAGSASAAKGPVPDPSNNKAAKEKD